MTSDERIAARAASYTRCTTARGIPYTVQVTFGTHYSIIMSTEQASKLGLFLRVTGVEVD